MYDEESIREDAEEAMMEYEEERKAAKKALDDEDGKCYGVSFHDFI